MKPGCLGLMAVDDEDIAERERRSPENGYSGCYRDDLSGQVLQDHLVLEARAKELAYFKEKGVWSKRPIGEAKKVTGKQAISVRWVDVNKGDDAAPKYRSRLVARQIKANDKSGDTFFAPMPPLEAIRTVLSLAMTTVGNHVPNHDLESRDRTQLSFVDVSRAYFNARTDPSEPCYVQLPQEDPDHTNMCGYLLRHMYGTRRAADGWQEEYSTMLVQELGFTQGISCPNIFRHDERGITCTVHGDDFTSCGSKDNLDWMEREIGKQYEITIGPRLGPGKSDAKEAVVLNRVVRWCEDAIEWEADPRQVERLAADCGLAESKPVATPGVRASQQDLEEEKDLEPNLQSAFRGAAARGNYISQDRVDAHFACKEVCRWMSKPTTRSWTALKRLVRYLSGAPRLVYRFPAQEVRSVDVYTDTDWAGCPRTRKSTSGGVVMFGSHAVKHWSSTQPGVSLSSGEAEYHGVVRGAAQGLGFQALLRDLGLEVPLRVWTDSSAAIGICSRQGLGKLRHLDTHTLWVQQAVRTGRFQLRKVPGEANPADLLTKHSQTTERLAKLVALFNCVFRGGRAESAPQLRSGGGVKMTMADGNLDTSDALGAVSQGELDPVMPHRTLEEKDLDIQYPAMKVEDDDYQEATEEHRDEWDDGYNRGLDEADKIIKMTKEYGRTRYEAARRTYAQVARGRGGPTGPT